MKKTIKVIDLLNKMANGEEVPKTIIYKHYIFENRSVTEYWCKKTKTCLDELILMQNLNDEVVIVEDAPKEDDIIKCLEGEFNIAKFMKDYPDAGRLLLALNSALCGVVNKINKGE